MTSLAPAAPPRQALLAARGLSRRYRRRVALAPLDVDVIGAEILAVVGPNGAGKSTLLALLSGALPPTAGRVEVLRPALRVAWVPQRPAVYGHLSARENLELFAALERAPAGAVERMLAALELPPDRRRARELSTGNQQRLNVAIALLADPDVLLLDEPTASLDPAERERFWGLVEERRSRGAAVVFATHHLEELAERAQRVLALAEGAVAFLGPLDAYPETA